MGQKIHPEGFRVGYIHDWKSNWYNEKEFADYLNEDLDDPLAHREQALARGPLRDHDRQGLRRGRGRHLDRSPGDRDRQVGHRGRRASPRAPQDHRQARQGQHQGDQAARARRQARRPVDRRAASEPCRLPARDEARPDLRDALRRQGREGPGLRSPRRRRDGHAPRATPTVACRCTPCARTSTTASSRRRRRPAGSASSAGSTRARSCPRASAPSTDEDGRRGRPEGVVPDVDAEAGPLPQADARPAAGLLQGRDHASPSASTGSRRSTAAGSPTARSRPPESR